MLPPLDGCFGPDELRTMFDAYERAKKLTAESPNILADRIIHAAMIGTMTVDQLVMAAVATQLPSEGRRMNGSCDHSA